MTQPSGPSHQIEMKEKQEIIRAEAKAATMHGRTDAEVNSVRGRYSATERSTIVGADPNVTYNTAPSWSRDPVPPEPPLGFSVSEPIVTGEYHEVMASIDDGPVLITQGSTPGAQGEPVALLRARPSTPPRSTFTKRKI